MDGIGVDQSCRGQEIPHICGRQVMHGLLAPEEPAAARQPRDRL